MSGHILEERWRVISLQNESLRHLKNALERWRPSGLEDVKACTDVISALRECSDSRDELTRCYLTFKGQIKPDDATVRSLIIRMQAFQNEVARAAGIVMSALLFPHWKKESISLIFRQGAAADSSDPENADAGTGKDPDAGKDELVLTAMNLPPHLTAAEEFFILPYLTFIQNILGSIHSIGLGSLWLFVGSTIAVSSYPFEPLNVLGGIFLSVFLLYAVTMIVVYSQMSRDATLSHITDTRPGELGKEFWEKLLTFGIGPLIGLLTTLFPSITDTVFSWIQPAQLLK